MARKLRERASALSRTSIKKTAGRRRYLANQTEVGAIAARSSRNDLLPPIRIELRAVSDLKPADRQTRRLTDEHLKAIIRSIEGHGFVGAILVRDGQIVDGHKRWLAAKKLGLTHVPTIPIEHLSHEQTRLLALSINRLAETGEWDLEELKIEMGELIALDLDLSISGFSTQEQDIILLDVEPAEADAEEIASPPDDPVSRLGDTFIAREHRIHCGDATLEESYRAALDGRPATTVISDPPYNVKIQNNVSGLGKHKHTEFVMASGEMSSTEFAQFLLSFITIAAAHSTDGAAIYVFMDFRSVHILIQAGLNADLKLINLAVWDKGAGGMGAFYRSAHELIPIFCKGNALAINNVQLGRHGRDRSNIFRYPGANRPGSSSAEALALHATPKNVDLIADMMLDVTHRGDVVLDPFLGSGTTIIAAEKTGRTACGIELDPRFVDVAVERWERLTGLEAVHAQSGLTFNELRQQRCDAASEGAESTEE